jgi:hypothetical protein
MKLNKRICVILIFIFALIIGILYALFIIKPIKEHYEEQNDIAKKMKQYNVIFGGTCRTVEPNIKNILNHIAICGKKFNDYSVIIYENDSSDRTREILNHNKLDNYHYIFEDNVNEPKRTKRLEHGRNIVLDKVREINKDNYYHYLIILDMDNVNNDGKFVETIDSCFVTDDWDVMAANQEGLYYDLWALRNKDLNHDCWYEHGDGKNICSDIKINYSSGKLIEADSAFGGGAIYKLSSIPNECRYNGVHENGNEKCEHVDFNKCIKNNGGKIYINPDFINDG